MTVHTSAPRTIGFLIVLAVAVAPETASAQFEPIDLETAIEVAIDRRPAVHVLDAQIAAAQARLRLDVGLTGPQLLYEREGMDDGAFSEQRFGLSQEIPLVPGIINTIAARQAEIRRLEAQRTVAQADVAETVKTAYIDVLYSRQLLGLRGRAVELGYQLLQAVQARIDVGESAEIDLLKAQLQEAEARDLLDAAEREYHRARYALFRSMGLEPEDQQYSVQFADSLRFRDVTINQDSLLGVLASFPEVVLARSGVSAAEKAAGAARFETFPRMTAGYFLQDFGDGYTHRGVQIGLRLPVGTWLTRNGPKRALAAELDGAHARLERATLDLKEDIERRWHSYDVSRRTLKRYEDSVGGRAELLVQLTRDGYLLGELDLLTLLDAQRTFVASRVRYLNAMRDYHRDLARLERYAGDGLLPFETGN